MVMLLFLTFSSGCIDFWMARSSAFASPSCPLMLICVVEKGINLCYLSDQNPGFRKKMSEENLKPIVFFDISVGGRPTGRIEVTRNLQYCERRGGSRASRFSISFAPRLLTLLPKFSPLHPPIPTSR